MDIMCAPSVLKWLSHSPFISKVSGSIFGRGLLSRLKPSRRVKKVQFNALLKVVGFLLRFSPTGKVDRVG